MGQRMVVLNSTYTGFSNNSGAVLHVSQVPPNPAIIAPGPALLFVVVKGVPSVGIQVMVGSGQIGPQPILPIGFTPLSTILGDDLVSDISIGSNAECPNPENCTSNAGCPNPENCVSNAGCPNPENCVSVAVAPTVNTKTGAGYRLKLGYSIELLLLGIVLLVYFYG